MASSAIPAVCRPIPIDGVPCCDSALGDPVPVRKAFELGCDKVVLILTLPENTIRTSDKDKRLVRRIRRKYPAAAEALADRARTYNEGVALHGNMRQKESSSSSRPMTPAASIPSAGMPLQ